MNELKRFWVKVAVSDPDDCWEWLAARVNGYGQFCLPRRVRIYAHRFSLALKLGRSLIGDEQALHTCDNPPCVNPNHLFLGTQSDNIKDCIAKGRFSKGEKNGFAKLTEAKVRRLRDLRIEENYTTYELADLFEAHQSTIAEILRKESWCHL